MCLPHQQPQTNCTISPARCPGYEMFQIFDSGLTQLTPAAHYSGSHASRGRHAGHAPARGEFLVMILLGTRVLHLLVGWDGSLDSAFSNISSGSW